MFHSRLTLLFCACAIALAFPAVAALDESGKPPIFTDISLADALKRNADDGRILVVKATAVWCGPCRRMDATTWRDESVAEWFREKGMAVGLDVDQHRSDARKLRIRSVPTMVAFRGGTEVHRVVGYQSGEELLAWLAAVERGETAAISPEVLMEAPREGDGALSMSDRVGLARELAQAGRIVEATDEYIWLWQNMVRIEPMMIGQRNVFMASAMRNLAQRDEAVMERFKALRDEAAKQRDDPDARRPAVDWVILNEVVGDEAATLAWFDEIAMKPDFAHRLSGAEQRIGGLLERHGRWADRGRMESEPVARLEQVALLIQRRISAPIPASPDMEPEELVEAREEVRRDVQNWFRSTAARLYASLLAAERRSEATQVADMALQYELEDPERMAQELVTIAIQAEVATAAHRDLLKERPLPASVREKHGENLPEEFSDSARKARRVAAVEALRAALAEIGEDESGKPPIFTDLSLADAIKQNVTDGRILVVKATAVWCGPCKRMDATTWRDESVAQWFREKGVALSLDVDQHRDHAQWLEIRAMPTMVAFRKGAEVHRAVGYQSGEDLLAWLAAVERGETGSSRLKALMEAPREGEGALRMRDRMALARELTQAGRLAEAADEYVWLWQNMVRIEPMMSGPRNSFLVASMQSLARQDEAALQRLTALRDEALVQRDILDGISGPAADWVLLNEVIGDEAATLAWFDEIALKPDLAQRLSGAERRISALLEREGRWADRGRMESAPLGRLEEEALMMHMMTRTSMSASPDMDPQELAAQREELLREVHERFRSRAAALYASLLAAERTDEAMQVADKALEFEPEDPERLAQELVSMAIRVGVATAAHRDLLKERPLTAAIRERFGDDLPEELSDSARKARWDAAVAGLDAALAEGGG